MSSERTQLKTEKSTQKTRQVQITVSQDEYDAIAGYARKTARTMSGFMRYATMLKIAEMGGCGDGLDGNVKSV
jgi:hypothetical protein